MRWELGKEECMEVGAHMGVSAGQWAWRRAVHTAMKDEVRRLQIGNDDARGCDGGHG